MILKITHGSVELSGNRILDDIDFEIKNKNEKIAVVGRNGCGKTTLLKLIAGDVSLVRDDRCQGDISKPGNIEIGYLRQISFEDETTTLDEEIRKVFKKVLDMKKKLDELVVLLSNENADHEKLSDEYTKLEEAFKDCNGYYYEKEYDMMLTKFGFNLADKGKRINEFSGGQRTKLAFIKMLLSKPDILLLDEPTNHLDVYSIEWLEGYIKAYPKAVVLVSHDRMFIDNTVDTVYEIERSHVKRYAGNYTYYYDQKRQNYANQLKAYNAQQKEIERLSNVAERFMAKATKTAMAQNKLKQIEHMDIIEKPESFDEGAFHASFDPDVQTGNDVLFVNDLEIGYDKVLSKVSIDLKKGKRVGIIGPNGVGKSTFLKTIVGNVEPISGEFSFGTNCYIGYFEQQMAEYSSNKRVIDDFWDMYPTMTETQVRNCLGAFLFTGDDVFKTVDVLSGGERVRLALCKIFRSKPNVLILDEPTNHMDIVGKEALEDMLKDYKGTVIFVSHDRYFVKKTADIIMAMDLDATRLYQFGYEDYLEKVKRAADNKTGVENKGLHKTGDGSVNADKIIETKAQASYREGKEAEKLRRKQAKIEEKIEQLEEQIKALQEQLSDPVNATDFVKLQKLQEEIDGKDMEMLELMEEFDAIS